MTTATQELNFLKGGGEMGEIIRSFNWNKNKLGPPANWPQNLKLTLSMILNSKFPMFLWWGDDMIQFYNDAYRPSLGNDGKHPKAVGQDGKECWPEIWDIIYPLIKQVRETGEATWSEDQLVPIYRNGKIEDVWWTFGYSPIYNEFQNELVEGVLVVCTETTGKMKAANALAESELSYKTSEQNLRNIILQAPVAMTLLRGRDFVVEIANERMYELWGRDEKAIAGKPIFEGLPEVKNQGFETILTNIFTCGKTYTALGVPLNVPRNNIIETIYINFVYEPYRDLEGTIDGVMAVAYDVTPQVLAQKKIEEVIAERTKELAEANIRLRKSNSELEQFAYIASHDLQEPLRKVTTYSHLLNDTYSPNDKQKKYLDKVITSATRMQALIKDVLTYSALEKMETFKMVNLNEIISGIKIDLELTIEQKSATIKYGKLPEVYGIALQMTQLFYNLISNSLKFSVKNQSPVIEITSSHVSQMDSYPDLNPSKKYIRIEVKDNGIGFSQQQAGKLFNIFQRLHLKSDYEGTGIGLAMCKRIVQNHQGYIQADSDGKNGAVFSIILPVSESEPKK